MKKHTFTHTFMFYALCVPLAILLNGGGIDIINTPWRFLLIVACLAALSAVSYRQGIDTGIEKGITQAVASRWLWPNTWMSLDEQIRRNAIRGGKWGRKNEFKPGSRKSRMDTGCLDETAADAYPIPAFLRKQKD